MTPLVVLIVDDDAQNRKLARDVLGAAGLDTSRRRAARTRSRSPVEQLPDVVLMDIRLPDLDGGEALRRLKAEPATAHIPVVALDCAHRRARGGSSEARLRRLHREADRRAGVSGPGSPLLRPHG